MKIEIVTRALGLVILIAGIIISAYPELITKNPIPVDTFDAIERRIWWGTLIGAGLLLLFNKQWSPWLPTLLIAATALIVGMLLARLLGIVLDGSVVKQWIWVLVELVIAAILLRWYFRVREK